MADQVLKVKVLASKSGSKWVGYYDHKRRQAGDVFILNEAKHFSKKWMEPIGWIPAGYEKPAAPKKAGDVKKLPRTPLTSVPQEAPPAAATEAGSEVI